MEKILTYIQHGKGHGMKYILYFSLILCILGYLFLGHMSKNIKSNPDVIAIVEQIPEIRIENGRIVEPANTVKSFTAPDEDVVFVLDTTRAQLDDLDDMPAGIYATTRYLYVNQPDGRMQVMPFSQIGDAHITRENIWKSLSIVLKIALVIGAIFAFITIWVTYAALYLLSFLLLSLVGRVPSDGIAGRTAALVLPALVIVDILLMTAGYGFSYGMIFLLAMIIICYICFQYVPRARKEVYVKVIKDEPTSAKPATKPAPVKKKASAKPAKKKSSKK
jgi:hypothetical protein